MIFDFICHIFLNFFYHLVHFWWDFFLRGIWTLITNLNMLFERMENVFVHLIPFLRLNEHLSQFVIITDGFQRIRLIRKTISYSHFMHVLIVPLESFQLRLNTLLVRLFYHYILPLIE